MPLWQDETVGEINQHWHGEEAMSLSSGTQRHTMSKGGDVGKVLATVLANI